MNKFPELETSRLVLKKLSIEDAPLITKNLQEEKMSKHTATIPFPYQEKDAIWWIKNSFEKFENKKGFVFGVFSKEDNIMIGAVDLNTNIATNTANFGYWTAYPFWNKGYMTEALKEVLSFGFNMLKLEEIKAVHFVGNPASGKVMLKAGMIKDEETKVMVLKDGTERKVNQYRIFSKNK